MQGGQRIDRDVFDVWHRFSSDEAGATSIEYGLIAVFVALAIISGATSVGTNLNETFNNVSPSLN